MRDAIFAALTLHIFYKNADIVEFAMETQLTNLLQSLFETDGEKCFRTPTFHIMKLLKPHMGQYLAHVLPDDLDPDLDAVATVSQDGNALTLSIVNRHLYESRAISLKFSDEGWKITQADLVTAENVRDCNSFENPNLICMKPFPIPEAPEISVPRHSVLRVCFEKRP